jgi:vesicle transport protein SEC22
MCISERSYPRKLAFTYLSDLSTEFSTTYPLQQVLSSTMRPYAFMEFDTFISRTKVTKVMTKNIEDLLYRGDSLERMGQVSSRLREDSAKYRRAAVRINWELLLSQYGPFAGVGLLILFLIWWRFF